MLAALVCLAAGALIQVTSARRGMPVLAPVSVMALAVLVPANAAGFLTPGFHPFAWLLAGIMAVLLVQTDERQAFLEVAREHMWAVYLIPLGFTVWTALDTLNVGGLGLQGLVQFPTMYYVTPVVIFVLVKATVARSHRGLDIALWSLFALGVSQAILVYRQATLPGQEGFVWVSLLEYSWFWSDTWSGPLGSTSHPIQMGLFVAALIPLLTRVRWVVLRFVLGGSFVFAATTASARTATVLSAGAVLFVILYGLRRWVATGVILAATIPTLVWFVNSSWARGIRNKFTDDGGSAQLRQDALLWSWHHREEFLFFGYPGGRELRQTGVLDSSLESGYIMYAFYTGILCALAFLAYHLVMAVRPLFIGGWTALPFVVSSLITLVGFFGSSSFMSRALEWTTFWFVLGLAYAVAKGREGLPDTAPEEGVEDPEPTAAPAPLMSRASS